MIYDQPLKWPGGKRRIARKLATMLSGCEGTYYEPFAGGASVFWALGPRRAVLSDINPELINLYTCLRDDPQAVRAELACSDFVHSQDAFIEVRNWDRAPDFAALPPARRAARFLYLNHSCFNGLWRVNRQGHCNSPWGRHACPWRPSRLDFDIWSQALGGVQIEHADFEQVLAGCRAGDIVYLDPPYVPQRPDMAVLSYTREGFGWEEQVRLRRVCDDLTARGVRWLMSNADVPSLHDLWAGCRIRTISTLYSIAADKAKRGQVNEILVTSGEEPWT